MKSTFLILTFLSCSILSFGQGLNFDGTDDYVQTTYSGVTGTGDRTIEAWIKTTGNFVPGGGGGLQGVLVDYGTFATGQRFTFNVLWANAIRLEVGGNGVSGTIPVNDGNWHHVAAVFSNPGNNVALYVDGVLDTQGSLTVAANTGTSNDVMIGRRVDGINNFPGDIDEVRIWDVARTQAEIQANMNAEFCGTQPNLQLYLKFNHGIAGGSNAGITTATDDSGNGNNGSLNNFALNGSSSNWTTGATLSTGGGTNTFASFSASNCGSYTLPSGNTVTSTGTYMDTIPNSQCGDSILTVNVTINTNTSSNSSLTVCNNYTAPNGDTYTSSQIVTYTIPNAAGCDSLVSLNLTVLNPSSSITETSCADYISPSGMVVTTSQIFTDIIPSFDGCDSTITIDLTIVEIDNSVIIDSINQVISNEMNPNATYQWFECVNGNLVLIQGETNRVITLNDLSNNKFYAVEITLNGCVDTSACIEFIWSNTENQYLQSTINIFPNPTNGNFTIDLGKTYQDIHVEIYSLDGKMISNQLFKNQQEINTKIEAISGLYQVKITTETGVVNRIVSLR